MVQIHYPPLAKELQEKKPDVYLRICLTLFANYLGLHVRKRGCQLKKVIRKALHQFVMEPERILGNPPSGEFWSSIYSIDTSIDQSQASIRLAKKIIQIGAKSLERDLIELRQRARNKDDLKILKRDFGEHYKFLEEICFSIQPNLVIEIGTHKGIGTLALSRFSREVVTFDIKPWRDFTNTFLLEEDFIKVSQVISDVSEPENWNLYREIFAKADLVFLDGPKDGRFEKKVLPLLIETMKEGSYLIIDDIRFLNMVSLWKNIKMPKFDATSIAHFSGTGVVQINSKFS